MPPSHTLVHELHAPLPRGIFTGTPSVGIFSGLRTTLHVVLYSPRVALLLYAYACSAQEARLLQGLAWESTQLWNEIRAHGSDSDSTRGNATSLNATLTS